MTEDWRAGGFGLYIHWPFCGSKCPYCDFNSHVSARIDQAEWGRAYVAEITRLAAQTQGRVLDTVFFGGGTPSLMSPDLVAQVIDAIRRAWPMRNDPEITLEANPTSIEAGRFRAYREAGVNRVSMGMQAMNDADLRRLGRTHSAAEAMAAFDIARSAFDRVSFDLIYARQDQTLMDWRAELTRALDLAVDHLSLYQLTVEDGTAFGARHLAGGLRGLPTDDLAADMYALTQDLTAAHGLAGYEISNHAREGAASRHNLIYWRGGDYVGIGPGAHGRLTLNGMRWATECPKSPDQWLKAAVNKEKTELPREVLTPESHATEYLMMSLRLAEGMSVARYNAISPTPLDMGEVADLGKMGLLGRTETAIFPTDAGKIVLNAIIRQLLT
ncbi:MAG: radical SAM family heme chaperone HemW [Cypionkella sp.]|nr:radical SAM family heme chaperone HemW [Cypionkella sp.]